MNSYTPTTNEVRDRYIAAALFNYSESEEGRAFNRWLADHDSAIERAAAARALTEAAEIAEALDFGPAPPFSRASAHQWGARQAAVRIRARAAEIREKKSE